MRYIILCLILIVVFDFAISGCSPNEPKKEYKVAAPYPLAKAPERKWEKEEPKEIVKIPDASKLDFTGLRGILDGLWAKKDGNYIEYHLEFHNNFIEQKDRNNPQKTDVYGKYEKKGDLIYITPFKDDNIKYNIEFISEREMILRPEEARRYFADFCHLEGKYERVSFPRGKAGPTSGPIAAANLQVRKMEQKFAKTEEVLSSTIADRKELVEKLRSVGVNTTSDLKDNIRGQQIAELLHTNNNLIDVLNSQLAMIDTEVFKAKLKMRRIEQVQAGLSEAEMRNLSQELLEAEERINKGPILEAMKPIAVEAAVEKALKAVPPTGTSQKKEK